MSDDSFLSRWSRRKTAVREGKAVPAEPVAPPQPVAAPAPVQRAEPQAQPDQPPAPTLADVALLQPGDNIARFVTRGVEESVKRAALKTLFADPHFNVMDGLDIYIDDYSKPDPIPPEVLRRLNQSEALGLFDPMEAPQAPETAAAPQLPTQAAEAHDAKDDGAAPDAAPQHAPAVADHAADAVPDPTLPAATADKDARKDA